MNISRRSFLQSTTALVALPAIVSLIPAWTKPLTTILISEYEYFATFDVANSLGDIIKIWADGTLVFERGKNLTKSIKLGKNIVSFKDFAIEPYRNRIPSISIESKNKLELAYILWSEDITEVVHETT